MMEFERIVWAHQDKGHSHFEPGEGPSAERLHREKLREGGGGGPTAEATPKEELLNQDGTRLGEAYGGSVVNPLGPSGEVLRHGQYEHASSTPVIGAEDAVLRDDGQRRELLPGISGGAAPSDLGTPGWLGGDPSNVGLTGAGSFGSPTVQEPLADMESDIGLDED